jgi:hypothetical protein
MNIIKKLDYNRLYQVLQCYSRYWLLRSGSIRDGKAPYRGGLINDKMSFIVKGNFLLLPSEC